MSKPSVLSEAIRHAADPMVLMQRVADQALKLVHGADGAVIELLDDQDRLEYVAAAGSLTAHLGLRLPAATSLSGQATRTRAVLRSADTGADPRVDAAACRRTGVASMLCVPLVRAGEGVGVLKVSSTSPRAFVDDDEATLTRLAEFIAITIGAAGDLARVTTNLLSGGERTAEAALDPAMQGSSPLSQFVANVLTPGMVEDVEARRRIRSLLRSRSYEIAVQPIVDLQRGTAVGVEALARFKAAPARSPDLWFAEAHNVGLGVDLELAALQAALDLLQVLPEHLYLALNVGPATVRDERLPQVLGGHALSRIVLEITEHDEIEDYREVQAVLNPLRRAGVRLAIDDTGAGFASLAHILQLAPDVIKLDRRLTRDLDVDPVRRALAASLVTFAAQTGATITAEGIETRDEADSLLGMGIRHGQGYYLARPGPVADLAMRFPQIHSGTPAPAASR